jgi:hypothetical protein
MTLSEIERRIRELKSEGHKSTDAYVRVRGAIHKLEREKEERERNGEK